MSRILKRPMFRTGGSTNEGIMHGLVNRRGYKFGDVAKQTTSDVYDFMKEMVPAPKARFPMGQMGLNLISGKYAGDGLLQNIAGSAQDPYAKWTEADDARRDYDRKLRMAAAQTGIKHAMEGLGGGKASTDWKKAKEMEKLGLINPDTKEPYTFEEAYESSRYSQGDISRASKAERIDQASAKLESAGYARGTKSFNERLFYRTEVVDQLLQMPNVTTLDLGGILPRSTKGNKGPKYNKMDSGKYYFDPKTRSVILYKGIDETLTPGDPGYYKFDTVLEF